MKVTATEALIKQEEAGVEVQIFERMMADFIDEYSPEDRYEAAKFSARINSMMRQLFLDVQRPMQATFMKAAMQTIPQPMFTDPTIKKSGVDGQ